MTSGRRRIPVRGPRRGCGDGGVQEGGGGTSEKTRYNVSPCVGQRGGKKGRGKKPPNKKRAGKGKGDSLSARCQSRPPRGTGHRSSTAPTAILRPRDAVSHIATIPPSFPFPSFSSRGKKETWLLPPRTTRGRRKRGCQFAFERGGAIMGSRRHKRKHGARRCVTPIRRGGKAPSPLFPRHSPPRLRSLSSSACSSAFFRAARARMATVVAAPGAPSLRRDGRDDGGNEQKQR